MSVYNDDQLYHVGIIGMKWGHHKTNFSSPNELQSWMKNNIKYSNFTKLKSPNDVISSKQGSCHDQVMLELNELKKMGLKPKAKFLIEYQPGKSQGGTTHSFVYYQKNGKTYWLENAWSGQEGLHKFDNINELTNKITP